ncbi:hypothetical protein BIY24_08035 [Halobacteriovorax marinus]|uniref:type IV pilus modification PilV family protein n=1 Tax=Halobacteriovorax marinus TaxID=97084 RepID=UPI000BC3458E|nr:hypothetical protein [Halobacteriovorax marinus]ATH07899.1 hypothetical protein BIY24_08035 [Halobacteriovorax marinus]
MNINDRGFSLVQVLISSGLLGAAALVGIKMMANQEKMAKSINQKYEMAYIHEEIWRALQDVNNCEATFAGKTLEEVASGKTRFIRKKTSKADINLYREIYKRYSMDQDLYGVENLRIISYVGNRRESAEPTFDLAIRFDKGENSYGSRFVTKTIPVIYSTRSSKIQNCNALPLGESASDSLLAEVDNSLKIGSNLGINTPAKKDIALDIANALSFSEDLEQNECNQDMTGRIRYDKSIENLLLCNGEKWLTWGADSIDWSVFTKVEVSPSKTESRPLGLYRVCALGKATDVPHTQCRLRGSGASLKTPAAWELNVAKTDIGSCTFLCFK